MGLRQAFSGFRAFSTTTQAVGATAVFPVEFQDDFTAPFGFDLMDEYDPTTTFTFTANQDGVYYVEASVLFSPNQSQPAVDYVVELDIVLNGTTAVNANLENVPASFFDSTVLITTSTILQLNAGDTLAVLLNTSGITGSILNNPTATHFEAARFPSP